MKLRFVLAAMLAGVALSTPAAAAKKYYISIGCYPDYKLSRISCDVGTSWKVCARAHCRVSIAAPRTPAEKARAASKEPKLFSVLPADAGRK